MYSSTPDPSQSRSADSWIEIPSGPSNSSSAAPNDIITTGLRVQLGPNASLRGAHGNQSPLFLPLDNEEQPSTGYGSSQDEYEESESESDRVMTSSNEGLPYRASSATSQSPRKEEDEYHEDGNDAAARQRLVLDQQCFTPQPNAFTHPPSSSSRHRASVPGSYFPPPHAAPSSQRHSFPTNQHRQAHSPYNAISPNHQADHDAALRASLTTLLSCAAAARGLPKTTHETSATTSSRPHVHAAPGRVDPTSLRMVPEAVALGSTTVARTNDRHQSSHAHNQRQRRLSASSHPSPSSPREPSPAQAPTQQDKNKRKATPANATASTAPPRSNSKDRRQAKKPRRLTSSASSSSSSPSAGTAVDPTLLTWVVSAGVLVLVSALSFSAGYATGREAGINEASATLGGAADGATGCGREVGRGLRRLRWGATRSWGVSGAS